MEPHQSEAKDRGQSRRLPLWDGAVSSVKVIRIAHAVQQLSLYDEHVYMDTVRVLTVHSDFSCE